MTKNCKDCKYYRNDFGYGQCYGQKNAPKVNEVEHCDQFIEKVSCAECIHKNVCYNLQECIRCEVDHDNTYANKCGDFL